MGAEGMMTSDLRIGVAICSVGRPNVLSETLKWLSLQTDVPSDVLLMASCSEDLPGLEEIPKDLPLSIGFAPKGLTRQRNAALDLMRDRCDILFFMDDDYWPTHHAIEVMKCVFAANPEVSGLTGHLLADGIGIGGLTLENARALMADYHSGGGETEGNMRPVERLYGCNMAIRTAAIGDRRFDENLPLYGWQEDVDFTMRLPGRKIYCPDLVGLHLGTTQGRETAGKRLGYSQVANLVYLKRKGILSIRQAWGQAGRNILANLLRSARPEPLIDRRARLSGNVIALWDLLRARSHPTRVQKISLK
jgi:hypothetical protein